MSKSVNGFSLVEMAVVLGVSAMVMGGGLVASKPVVERMQKQKTERQMEKINDQLASFVHRNNRLPCPASPNPSGGEPFGSEIGSGGSGPGSCVDDDAVGIVPFRVLGLKEKEVRDAWGDFITYHVSPVFAINDSDIDEDDHNVVHEFCRADDWIESIGETEKNAGSKDATTKAAMKKAWEQYDVYAFGLDQSVVDESGNLNVLVPETADDGIDYQSRGLGVEGNGQGLKSAEQINYDPNTKTSETLLVDLGSTTNKTVARFSNLYKKDNGVNGAREYGEWLAYDSDGLFVGSGVFGDDTSDYEDGASVGTFTIEASAPYKYVAFRALPYGGATEDGQNPNGMTGDSSDYYIRSMDFATANPVANINPAKARFCCPMVHVNDYKPLTDIKIVDENGTAVVPQTRSTTNSAYDDKDEEAAGSIASDIFVPAFTLISHGKNRYGAFLANGSNNRVTLSGTSGEGFGDDEIENSNDDNVYVYRLPDMTNDVTYFDDIVMWRTQDQIYGEFGNQTCQKP